ncbi:SDR family oxidoreductase [Leucobacter sp. CSA1]|uniref:SDR family oxidoreductase n=1 Tax=Leucobacter chromiisoli TaxID=2796471 RepID=A0A934UV25_9MICO|nr:SDR family oxidoreductase [Leucobacter chromiisoli]MBK0418788.1 SDR family oxidoreductase [Leucobacter chromiisoli]
MVTTNVLDAFRLEGQTALVTGASRGLGLAMARALGELGATVVLTARTGPAAEAAAALLVAEGIDAHGRVLEVSDRDDVDRCVTDIEATVGYVDVLVNNAGVSIGNEAFDVTDEEWRTVFGTNVDGVWHCSRRIAHSMRDQGIRGRIVNMGSISAEIVNRPRWQAGYLASKAAVHQLTRGLAVEWAPHGLRVNAIAPGYFLTEMSPVDQPEYYEHCIAPTPLKRWGEPVELGPVVALLSSEASAFMTGSVVTIDGGYTLF